MGARRGPVRAFTTMLVGATALVATLLGAAEVRLRHSAARPALAVDPPPPQVLGRREVTTGTIEQARALRDLAYGPRPHQLVDIEVPERAAGTTVPALLYVHSGGWVGGSRVDVPGWLRDQAAATGAALVSVDYALATGEASWPAAAHDLDRAIRWLKHHAPAWAIDPDGIVVVGISAGGHLGAIAGAAPGALVDPSLPAELAAVDPRPAGVVLLAAIADLTSFRDAGAYASELTAALLGCPRGDAYRCDDADLAAASPIGLVSRDPSPAFLIYGDDDSLVQRATQGDALVTAWRETAGDDAARFVLVDGDHHINRWTLPLPVLRSWLDERWGRIRPTALG
jgi:acetyl esterase/lipase